MISPDGPGPKRAILAILSGALLALSYPRFDLFPLAFVALVPLLAAAGAATVRGAFGLGLLTGITFNGILLYWLIPVMERYGGLPGAASIALLGLLVLYLSLYTGAFAAVVTAWTRRYGDLGLLLAPIAWVALELARARVLGGFPWGLLGYSQYRNLPVLQVASLGSVYAVSFVVAACNAAVAVAIPRAGRGPRVPLWGAAGVLAAVAAVHLGGALALHMPPAGGGAGEVVALVQANVPQDRKWDRGAEDAIVGELIEMTRGAAAAGARIVIWPESSSPLSFRRVVPARPGGAPDPVVEERPGYADRISAVARELDIELIAGSVDYRVEGGTIRALNSAFRVGADGSIGPTYDKVQLVPFGEYVPLRRLLFFVNPMVEGAIAEFAPGRRFEPLPTRAGPAATVICYEAIFPRVVARIARRAAFLVNITNDAWFGRSAGPHQHLAMAIVRSVELRRDLARAANTGISALVDPYGRIVQRSELEERTVLLGRVRPRSDRTLCAVITDRFAWACAILTPLLLFARRRARARDAPDPARDM